MGVQGPAESVARGLGARLEGLRRAGPLERVQTQGSDDRTQEVPGLGLTVPEGAVELEGAGVRRPVQEQEPQAGTPTGAREGALWCHGAGWAEPQFPACLCCVHRPPHPHPTRPQGPLSPLPSSRAPSTLAGARAALSPSLLRRSLPGPALPSTEPPPALVCLDHPWTLSAWVLVPRLCCW